MSYTGVYFPTDAAVTRVLPPLVRVLVNGKWRTGLRPVSIEQRLGRPPRARLELDIGRPARGGVRYLPESALRAIGPDDLVRIEIVRGGRADWRGLEPLVLVEGKIQGPAFSYDSGGEAAGFDLIDSSAMTLDRRVCGQQHLIDGDLVPLDGLELTFNAGGLGNRSAFQHDVEGRSRHLFVPADSDEAEAWTAAQAANYLISFYAGGGGSGGDLIELPDPGELATVFGNARCDDVTVEGLTLIDALDKLGRDRGVRTAVALGRRPGGEVSRRLVFAGRQFGRRTAFYHQMPGERFSLSGTAMSASAAEIQWQEAVAEVEIAGDVMCYESTFNLIPGWDRSLENRDREDYVRSGNADFDELADVFRRWVLNESGAYCGATYGGGSAPYDLSGIFGTSDYVPRSRRFLPTISVNHTGESHGIVLEWSTDGGTTWSRYGSSARALRQECGIYLSADRLPSALFRAWQRDELQIRVTATIESDLRLAGRSVRNVSLGDDTSPLVQGRRLWLDRCRQFRYRRVLPTSIFYGSSSREVDDTQRIADEAASIMAAGRYAPCRWRAELPFFSISYQLGDRVDGVRNRSARLARDDGSHQTAPMVETVRQVFDANGWKTELELA